MPDGPWIVVKHWDRYAPKQRNKTATMPWLRLYRKLLEDRDYRRIQPEYRALLVDLWLLAAENDGKVLCNYQEIAWRLRVPEEWLVSGLEAIGMIGFIEMPEDAPVYDLPTGRVQAVDKPYAERRGEEGRGDERKGEKKTTATWLTPFLDAWVAECGGVPPAAGRVGRAVSPLVKEHGADAVSSRLRFYLRQSNGKASIEHFAQTFGKWDPAHDPGNQRSSLAGPRFDD